MIRRQQERSKRTQSVAGIPIASTSIALLLLVFFVTLSKATDVGSLWSLTLDEPASSLTDSDGGAVFNLLYDVDSSITDANLIASVTEKECPSESAVQLDGTSQITDLVVEKVDGEPTRAKASFKMIMNELIKNSNVLEGDDTSGVVKICTRFGLQTSDGTYEVNFLETIITINFSFDGDFDLTFSLDQKAKTDAELVKDYGVEGYLCDPNDPTIEYDSSSIVYPGTPLGVCVRPDAAAIADGLSMKSIDSFTWERGNTKQEAIVAGQADGLTELVCENNVCKMQTVLLANFFRTTAEPSSQPSSFPSLAPSSSPTVGMKYNSYAVSRSNWRCNLDVNIQKEWIGYNEVQRCFNMCKNTEGCDYFSWGLAWKWECCLMTWSDLTQTDYAMDSGFTTYMMLQPDDTPPSNAYFTQSGNCVTYGNCVASPNFLSDTSTYSGTHGNSENCNIVPHYTGMHYLDSIHFDTETNYDKLDVGSSSSTTYMGQGLQFGPHFYSNPNSVWWRTDGSVVYSGFKVCLYPMTNTADGRRLGENGENLVEEESSSSNLAIDPPSSGGEYEGDVSSSSITTDERYLQAEPLIIGGSGTASMNLFRRRRRARRAAVVTDEKTGLRRLQEDEEEEIVADTEEADIPTIQATLGTLDDAPNLLMTAGGYSSREISFVTMTILTVCSILASMAIVS